MPSRSALSVLPPLTIAALLAAPTAAFAHPDVAGHVHGALNGFVHPLGGIDHILAMVTVGVFAYQLGGRALWLVPATFVLLMAGGGTLALAGIPIPLVEVGIALSVIVLGAVIALGIRAPVAVAMGLVGFFAIFHGHAHGAEMPADAAGAAFGLGFVAATALLHALGVGIGHLVGAAGARHGQLIYRMAGSVVVLAGIGMLAGVG